LAKALERSVATEGFSAIIKYFMCSNLSVCKVLSLRGEWRLFEDGHYKCVTGAGCLVSWAAAQSRFDTGEFRGL
jgi:hypothetical protein